MGIEFNPWVHEEPIVEKAYNGLNYKVVDNRPAQNGGTGRCVIYCSSNDLWYPNTREIFQRTIIKNNRYEWTNITKRTADREIFIRDIYKSWYVTGISNENNTIEKVVALIKELTKGYTVSTIGISAGGYMAIIIGCLIKAEFVIAFSPQTNLMYREIERNPLLQKYQNDSERFRFYNIKEIMGEAETPVYYIVGNDSKEDEFYYHDCKDLKWFRPILFKSNKHGAIVERSALKAFTSYTKLDWDQTYNDVSGREVNPFLFSIKVAGLNETIKDEVGRIGRGVAKLKRKMQI